MATANECPECGSAVAADDAGRPCPACLMKLGLASWTERGAQSDDAARLSPTTPRQRQFEAPLPADLAGKFPQLEILELIGQGGMGAVYKARQTGLDRWVALKILPLEVAGDPGFAERFTREARALAKLNHPNIVAVYDFGRAGELYYFVMEYVDGPNLRQTILSGSITPNEALAIVPQICDALQFAHDEGIVHRDIKPENILLGRGGRVKIADFGLAKLLGLAPVGERLTATQQVMGTPQYMAPEQFERPRSVDHRTDIYALGVVFYEMLTGELPIGRFAAPSKIVQVDVRLDEVVLRALEKEPERRYQQASQVKTHVDSIRASQLAGTTSPPEAGHQRFDYKANAPMILLLAISMVVCGLVMAAGVALAAMGVAAGTDDPNRFWGWMGAAFGCFFGGAGGLAGTWNSYRQLEGAGDLMHAPGTTWLDWTLWGYFGFGWILLSTGALIYQSTAGYPLMALGGTAVVQAMMFIIIRGLLLRSIRAENGMEGTEQKA